MRELLEINIVNYFDHFAPADECVCVLTPVCVTDNSEHFFECSIDYRVFGIFGNQLSESITAEEHSFFLIGDFCFAFSQHVLIAVRPYELTASRWGAERLSIVVHQ